MMHRTRTSRVLILGMFSIVSMSNSMSAVGQEAFDQPPVEQRVITLKHAKASHIADVVMGVFVHCNIGVDKRSNSLVTTCEADEIEKISALITQLDKPVHRDLHRQFIRVPNASPRLKAILLTGMSEDARVEVDPMSELVVIVGQPRDIAYAHETIAMIENQNEKDENANAKDSTSYRVHFYFVSMQYDAQGNESNLPPLPVKLEPVGESLMEHGFYHPRLLSSMLIQMHVDNVFELTGNVDLSSSAQQNGGQVEIEVEGAILSVEKGHALLEIEGQIKRRQLGDGKSTEKMFNVRSTISCAIGDYVVMSASPADTGLFDAVALVVHVTP